MASEQDRRHILLRVLLLLCLLGSPLYLVIRRGKKCLRCEMSIMVPGYEDLSSRVQSSYAYKYRTFRYHDLAVGGASGNCIPALFVPGSVGSYRQVRSLGSAVLPEMTGRGRQSCYDFYAVDFRQEFVAFSPELLRQQARYTADAIRYLQLHFEHSKSLVLIGHSFGGVVARMAATLDDDLLAGRRVLMLTLSTPHNRAPLVTGLEMASLYAEMNQGNTSNNAFVLNVASASSDILVPATLSGMSAISNSLTTRADKLSLNGADPNHQAVVWERGLMRGLASILKGIADGSELRHNFGAMIKEAVVGQSAGAVLSTLPQRHLSCHRILSAIDGESITGMCSHGKGATCVQFNTGGAFQFATGGDPDGVRLYFGRSVSTSQDSQHLTIAEPASAQLTRDSVLGGTFTLDTSTEAVTQITEKVARFKGKHDGAGIAVFDCGRDLLHGMNRGEWAQLVLGGDEIYQDLRSKVRAELFTYHEEDTKELAFSPRNVAQMLFGKTILIKAGDNRFRVMGIHSTVEIAVTGASAVWTEDASGRRVPGHSSSRATQTITLSPDVRELVLYSPTGARAKLNIKILDSALGSLIEDPGAVLINLYVGILISGAGLGAGTVLLGLVLRSAVVSPQPANALGLLLLICMTLWIVSASIVANSLLTRSLPSSRRRHALIFGILCCAAPVSYQARASMLTICMLAQNGLTRSTVLTLIALLPACLTVASRIRNLAVLVQEIGVSAVIHHELRWTMLSDVRGAAVLAAIVLGNFYYAAPSKQQSYWNIALIYGMSASLQHAYQLAYLQATNMALDGLVQWAM